MNQIMLTLFILKFLIICTNAQQNYSSDLVQNCNNSDKTGPSPAFLYTCNGQCHSCQTFLIIKSKPAYNSVSSISALTSSNPSELAMINNVTEVTIFPTNKEVIVPVNCFCFGKYYYQANTTFNVTDTYGTYYTVAGGAYQGLTTCDSLERANPYSEYDLRTGLELQVPLRCACPTKNQTGSGTRYLVTYLLDFDSYIPDISNRFKVSEESILYANGLEENPNLTPSTTILIPLPTQPSSLQMIIDNQTDLAPPPASSPVKRESKRKIYKVVGLAAGCSLVVLNIILFAVFLFYKKRSRGVSSSGNEINSKQVLPEGLRVEIASFEQVLRVFEFEEIRKATKDFSSENRVKGSVYRGVFDGEILVVKRMSADVSKEVQILKKINHFNLIMLQGVCESQGCFYVVFEYMKNGSLREWLRNKSSGESRSWSKRIQIALDVANGLHYLHSFTEPAYVHKDIKSSNVLLDSNLRAKIANFSLARAAERETTSAATTTRVVGTRGYMAPEYIKAGLVTTKIDVYAFGVVLLELITGKDAIIVQDGKRVLLSGAIVSVMERENAEAELDVFVDPILKGNNGIEFAVQVAKLSIACLSQEPARRPSMEEVVSTLLKIQADLQKPESSYLDPVEDSPTPQ